MFFLCVMQSLAALCIHVCGELFCNSEFVNKLYTPLVIFALFILEYLDIK